MVLDWRQHGNSLESDWCLNKSSWFGINTHCKLFLCFFLHNLSYMSYMICVQVFIFPLAFGKEGVRRKAEEGGSELWAGAQPLSHFPFQPRPALCQPSFQAPFSLPASCARHSTLPGMLFVCRNIIIASTWDTWSKQLRLIVYLNDVRCTSVSSFLIQAGPVRAVLWGRESGKTAKIAGLFIDKAYKTNTKVFYLEHG